MQRNISVWSGLSLDLIVEPQTLHDASNDRNRIGSRSSHFSRLSAVTQGQISSCKTRELTEGNKGYLVNIKHPMKTENKKRNETKPTAGAGGEVEEKAVE